MTTFCFWNGQDKLEGLFFLLCKKKKYYFLGKRTLRTFQAVLLQDYH